MGKDWRLSYYADCEASGRHPPADEAMLDLMHDGFLTVEDVGWGHRRVALTPAGRAELQRRTSK